MWYSNTKPDAAQGIVYEESTGKNIAISYDTKDARLIAAAPELLAACEQVLLASEDNGDMNDIDWNGLRNAVAKATKD